MGPWPSLLALSLIVACGGGGGGGDSGGGVEPVLYTGNTSAAIITTSNAALLVANLLGSEETATTIVGTDAPGSAVGRSHSAAAVDLVLRRSLRNMALRAGDDRPSVQAAVPVDETEACDNGVGAIHTTGTLSDVDFTGTLAISFSGCLVGSDTLDGTATLRVDAFNSAVGVPTDSTLSFARLSIRGPGSSIDAGGSLRMQLDLGASTETITSNLVTRDNNAARVAKTENVVFVSTYNVLSPNALAASVSGRVYDQVHGYVDVATPAPLIFRTPDQLFPDRGQIVLTGASNRRIRATALSTASVRLELDLAGAGFPIGKSAVLGWTQLSGPAGADLRDDDNDGMHNSWETAHGLNPNGAGDAAADADGDGTSNIREYYAGSNPNSAGPVANVESTVDAAPFFATVADYAAGTSPRAIAVGDFNGDGKADVAVANWWDNGVSVLLGDGAGAFGAATRFDTGNAPTSVVVGDFNGDGKLDLAVANFGGPSISILLGNGSGGFAAPVDLALTGQMNPTAVAAGDFNGDGKLDLAVTMSFGFGNVTPGQVAVLLGNGLGGFGAPASFAVGGTPVSVATGDFNGDGELDLAVANSLVGTLSVLLGDGNGAFAAAPDLAVDGWPSAVTAGDFNGDGKVDLAVTVNSSVVNNASVAILTGTGAGTFAPATVFVLDRVNGANLTALALADFDGNGKLDLAVSDERAGCAFVLLGDGAGSFGTTNYVVALGGAPAALAVGHFNGDAKPDLVGATASGGNAAFATVSLNTLP